MTQKALLASTLLCAVATVVGHTRHASAEAPFAFAATPGQLPKTIVPTAYDIDLVTDMTKLTLAGQEHITVDVRDPTETLVLNQAGLVVVKAEIDGTPLQITEDEKAQTVTLRASHDLSRGTHRLNVSYTGPIIQTPNGIYYNDYHDPTGTKKRMLVTQFEVADARRMFPCWDEPVFKATFKLTVTLPKTWVPVSNMPVTATASAGTDAQRVSFGTTPRMSTYLLALVAGDLAAVHGKGGDTPINTYAPKGEERSGEYATRAASHILPYYNDYFGVKYPLPKMDLLAIPGNYEAGAMENWGAITFIDEDLLYDSAHSAPATKEYVYLVVAHEMAHQWSGDLVTMAWWDNIWLNEGFATWMETKALDHFNPTWEIWPREHAGREEAMGQDALSTTHPIQQVVHDATEADHAFDRISYQKGEQVIRMVETWLGPDVFRGGMRRYMKAHAYSSATSADLWNALSEESHQDVGAVARTFTERPGVPLVHVARRCDAGQAVFTLTQSRFSIHDPQAKPLTWRVPVVLGGPGVATVKAVLGDAPITLRVRGCGATVKANFGEGGYYRTIYDDVAYASLRDHFAQLGSADRVNLLGDQFALFQAGLAPLSAYLDLVARLSESEETSVAVWQDTLDHLNQIDALERGAPGRAGFRVFARHVLAPQLARLGWDARPGEVFLNSLLRPRLIQILGLFGDPSVMKEAHMRYDAWRANHASLDPSLQRAVMQIVGAHADDDIWNTLAAEVRDATDTEQKRRFFSALARSPRPGDIEKAFHLTYSGAMPNGRIMASLVALAENSENPDLVWRLTYDTQTELRKHLAPRSQAALLPKVAATTLNPEIAKQMLDDPSSTVSNGARLDARQAAEEIAANIDLAHRTTAAIDAWLHGRNINDKDPAVATH